MNNKPNIAVLIVAAGTGTRFGSTVPKQYLPLLGRPVLRWSLDVFAQHPAIGDVFTVIHPDHAEQYRRAAEGLQLPPPVIGGATRQETVRLGLEAIAARGAPDFILIHDAARPGLTPALLERICAELSIADAVIPGLPVTDTVRRETASGVKTENREGLYTIQTPQAFRFETVLALHRQHKDAQVTDDAALFELAGKAVKIIEGERGNFKVTHNGDLSLMEQAIAYRCGDVRTATGYDVHKFTEPQHDLHKLKICGVDVPHARVLEGHSDADVGLHAITDAILGCVCDGDIGMHFSPKDARWKGADSSAFLRHAAGLVAAQGGVIAHVDVTLICEEPKIGPHREKMRARIGEILQLPVTRISVKATTTEGLGFTGRREGIAAEAAVTVRLPFAPGAQETSAEARNWGT